MDATTFSAEGTDFHFSFIANDERDDACSNRTNSSREKIIEFQRCNALFCPGILLCAVDSFASLFAESARLPDGFRWQPCAVLGNARRRAGGARAHSGRQRFHTNVGPFVI